MADEQVIRLLQEIRDLQKQHVENYRDALRNQQEAIVIQKSAVRRQKITLLVAGLLLAAFLPFLAWVYPLLTNRLFGNCGSACGPVIVPVFKTGGRYLAIAMMGSTPIRFRQILDNLRTCKSLAGKQGCPHMSIWLCRSNVRKHERVEDSDSVLALRSV